MKILISNDDGYLAPGINILAKYLAEVAEIDVVAPDRNKSGASSSLTLEYPIRAEPMGDRVIRVHGTPSDCVHLAVTGLLKQAPDMVVSGINHGANLGDDVIYSGTVAAAIEGRFLGYPAIAVSICAAHAEHLESAAKAALQLVENVRQHPIPNDVILNVNVPDLPWDSIKGFKATRLGNRHKSEPVIESKDPRGIPIYWVGPAGPAADCGPGTDFDAVNNGFISVTPLQVDLTRHTMIQDLQHWLEKD